MALWVVGSILHGAMGCYINPSWCYGLLDQSLLVYHLSCLLFKPVVHNWSNKGHGDGAYKISFAANQKEQPMKW